MAKYRKVKFTILGVVAIFLVLTTNYLYQYFVARKEVAAHIKNATRICPDYYFVNRMPQGGVYTTFSVGEFLNSAFRDYVTNAKEKIGGQFWIRHLINENELFLFREGGYFTVKGVRKELIDTDLVWVLKNCTIEPSYVY